MFTPVARKSLSESVYETLRDKIVSGELDSGSKLPSERALSQLLQVNRGAVREALKRLEQARLVSIRQGGAAKVLDYRRTAGMDMLSELLFAGGGIDIGVALGVLEMRAVLGPEIARRCAERGGEAIAERLEGIVEAFAATEDLSERQDQSLLFWEVLVEGSQNVAFRLAYNSLRLSYDTFRKTLVQILSPELKSVESFRAVAEAVRAGDGEAARERASALLDLGEHALKGLLDDVASTGDSA